MKLFKLNDHEYLVSRTGKPSVMFPSYKEAALYMYDTIGMCWSEIELGFTEMEAKGHQVAHYGIGLSGNGPSFIFTDKLAS